MAFNKFPAKWLGPGYSVAASEIKIATATHAALTVGTSFTGDADDDVLTFAADHNLRIGDKITVAGGSLPTGMTAGDYYVKTVPSATTITVSETPDGDTLDLTVDGSGTATTAAYLAEVTDAEAAEATGDIRKVIFGIMEMLYTAWSRIASADRPAKLTIYRSSQSSGGTTLTHTYTVVVQNSITAQEVEDEA